MSWVKGSKHTKVHGFKSEFNTQPKWSHTLYHTRRRPGTLASPTCTQPATQRDVWCKLCLKCNGTRAETRFRLSPKRTNPFNYAGSSVQATAGSRYVRISDSNAWCTILRGSVKGTCQFPLHFSTLASPCAITFQLDSTHYRHCSNSQGDQPKEGLQAGTGERKREGDKNPHPKQETMLQRSRRKNVHVTILPTDNSLVSYITLAVRLIWAVALFQYWIDCLGIVILLIVWQRKGCSNKHTLFIFCDPTQRKNPKKYFTLKK